MTLADWVRVDLIAAAHRHPTLDHRKIHTVLQREGTRVGRKRVHRVLHAAGRRYVLQNFDRRVLAAKYLQVLDRVRR